MEIIPFKPRQPVIPPTLTLTSFEEAKRVFILSCKAKNLSGMTIPWYEKKLECFEVYIQKTFPTPDLNLITPEVIKDFICYLQEKAHAKHRNKPLSSYTVAGIVRVLKVFFHFLEEEGYLPNNPSEKIKVPKVQKKIIKPLSEGEIQKLLHVSDLKTFSGLRNQLILLVFLDTGIRLSELRNLKLQDVDQVRFTFRVLGKGNKEREVPFGMSVAKTLIKYLKWRGEISGQDYLFVDSVGQRIHIRTIEKIVEQYARKAGLEGVHCHRFRHTFALNWIKYGGDAFSLQRILGHTTMDMVRNYVNLAGEDIVMKHRQFGLIDRLGYTCKT